MRSCVYLTNDYFNTAAYHGPYSSASYIYLSLPLRASSHWEDNGWPERAQFLGEVELSPNGPGLSSPLLKISYTFPTSLFPNHSPLFYLKTSDEPLRLLQHSFLTSHAVQPRAWRAPNFLTLLARVGLNSGLQSLSNCEWDGCSISLILCPLQIISPLCTTVVFSFYRRKQKPVFVTDTLNLHSHSMWQIFLQMKNFTGGFIDFFFKSHM